MRYQTAEVHYQASGSMWPPSPEVRTFADAFLEKDLQQEEKKINDLQQMVSSMTSRNDAYADELMVARQYFDNQGVPTAPTTILGETDYNRVETFVFNEGSSRSGVFKWGYVFIKEEPEVIKTYGANTLLRNIVHEMTHSTAYAANQGVTNALLVTKELVGPEGNHYDVRLLKEDQGFRIPAAHRDRPSDTRGEGLEEFYAEFKAVDALFQAGRAYTSEKHIAGASFVARYIGNGLSSPLFSLEGNPAIPVRYCGGVVNGRTNTSYAAAGAFALELLDDRLGIVADMDASRYGADKLAAKRSLAKKIESVRPGLYYDLQAIPSANLGEVGSKQALRLVIDALGITHYINE